MASPAFITNEITNTFSAYDQQDAAFHVKEILGEVTTLGGKNGKIFDAEPANKMGLLPTGDRLMLSTSLHLRQLVLVDLLTWHRVHMFL